MTRRVRKKINRRRSFKYQGIRMASGGEVKFAEQMDCKGIPWEYEPEKFDWIPPNKKYTPDFLVTTIKGNQFYVEYKGYLRPTDRTKMRAIKKQHPDLDIRFVFENAKKPIYKGSKTTYGQWAEKLGYLWAESFLPLEWCLE